MNRLRLPLLIGSCRSARALASWVARADHVDADGIGFRMAYGWRTVITVAGGIYLPRQNHRRTVPDTVTHSVVVGECNVRSRWPDRSVLSDWITLSVTRLRWLPWFNLSG